jgi:hypothetical protein
MNLEHNGHEYTVTIEDDTNTGAPWLESEGHGPVSEWTTRDKRPGELVLSEDGRAKRFYDFSAACKLARADGWDAAPYNTGQESKRQQAQKAALSDFDYLRRWCAGDWRYVGVTVRRAGDCACCAPSESVWGVESGCEDYILEIAAQLADELSE